MIVQSRLSIVGDLPPPLPPPPPPPPQNPLPAPSALALPSDPQLAQQTSGASVASAAIYNYLLHLAAAEAIRLQEEQNAAARSAAAAEARRLQEEQEAARLAAAEARRLQQKQEAARLAAAEANRIQEEKETAERAAAEARRLQKEQKAAAEAAAAEAERERLEREQAEAARVEAERKAAEAEAVRIAQEEAAAIEQARLEAKQAEAAFKQAQKEVEYFAKQAEAARLNAIAEKERLRLEEKLVASTIVPAAKPTTPPAAAPTVEAAAPTVEAAAPTVEAPTIVPAVAVSAVQNPDKADTKSVEISPSKIKSNTTAQLLRELLKEINLKRDRNNKLIITEEEKQKFLERFNKIPSRNNPGVAGLYTTITRSLEQASVPKAPPLKLPVHANSRTALVLKHGNLSLEHSKLSHEIFLLQNDIRKYKDSKNPAKYTLLINRITDILQRIRELNAERKFEPTINQLKKSQEYLQAQQNAARPANLQKKIEGEPNEKSMESNPIETPIKPIGSLSQHVNDVKSKDLPEHISALEKIARNIHDLSIKKFWKIPKEKYETLKQKYETLKSTVNTTPKSKNNTAHINSLTKLVANNSKTIESKLKMNATDNIIAQTALPGRNPFVASVLPKPPITSAQLPKGARNSVAALLQEQKLKQQVLNEQAYYAGLTQKQKNLYNATLNSMKDGTRKRNHTYKKK